MGKVGVDVSIGFVGVVVAVGTDVRRFCADSSAHTANTTWAC